MSGSSEGSTIAEADADKPGSVGCVVAYEDTTSRDRALRLCDDLVRKLWNDLEFEFSWWRFDYLGDEVFARVAAESAIRSDITIFAARTGGELPPKIRTWVDDWSRRRLKGYGVLVALIGTTNSHGITPAHSYLRRMAEQAAMEFLPQMSDRGLTNREITFDEIEARANRKTSLLNDILEHPDIATHWGLNE